MRLRVVRFIFFLAILVVILRLGYWQIVRAEDLSVMAEAQRVSKKEIKPSRGTIYFSDRSTLATTQPSYLLFAQPKTIIGVESELARDQTNTGDWGAKKDYFSGKLAEVFFDLEQSRKLPIEATTEAQLKEIEDNKKQLFKDIKDDIFKKIDRDLYWVSLNREVDSPDKERLENLNLKGIGYELSTMRYYPEGSSSAHLLGFVGSDVYGGDTGYFGLEGFYNGELRGKGGTYVQEKDALGLPILIGKFIDRDALEGKSLVLNIDRTIQHMAEEKLKAGMEKYGAKGGSVVIMDPNTGGILAMASFPNYDPSYPFDFPKDYHKNPITADSYEPGSTFKVLVMAAGINEGVVKPDTRCNICEGPLNLAGFTIRTWNNQYTANSTMTDVIVHSDNIGMVFVARKLGLDKFYTYLDKFGLGKPTNVDLEDDSSPTLRLKDELKEIDLATASFGQGIPVTALQLVRAVGAIANDGKLMEPHIVAEIIGQGKTYKVAPRIVSEPIKPETARQVTEIMVQAVDRGEAQFYKKKLGVEDYKIAGKTGTAQIPIKGHYDANKTIASFVGFAPADNPKFVMLVRYTEPTSSIYGADTAAPTFFEIAKEIFTYKGIAPN